MRSERQPAQLSTLTCKHYGNVGGVTHTSTPDCRGADIHSVTVPGAADGWANAVAKWGNLSLAEVLEPAAVIAEEGFPVSQFSSKAWGSRYHFRTGLAQLA